MIVCKFGGSCTARPGGIEKIKDISFDKRRTFFVFSAIGKKDDKDEKLTDLLINYLNENNLNNKNKIIIKIKNKINSLLEKTGQKPNFDNYLNNILKIKNNNLFISRGEFLTTKIMAKYLGLKFVPAEKLIVFKNGVLDEKETRKRLLKLKNRQVCTCGFYGFDKKTKEVVLFERGGGDTTGAIISKLINADIYENYTDVCGVMTSDPKSDDKAKTIEEISYEDMFEMSKHGAKVLHQSVCEILKKTKVETHVKNLFDLGGPFTKIGDKN